MTCVQLTRPYTMNRSVSNFSSLLFAQRPVPLDNHIRKFDICWLVLLLTGPEQTKSIILVLSGAINIHLSSLIIAFHFTKIKSWFFLLIELLKIRSCQRHVSTVECIFQSWKNLSSPVNYLLEFFGQNIWPNKKVFPMFTRISKFNEFPI